CPRSCRRPQEADGRCSRNCPDCARNASEARAQENEPQSHQAIARIAPSTVSAAGRRSSGFLRCVRHDGRSSSNSAQIGGHVMARTIRKPGVKEVPLTEIKHDPSRFLREAEMQELIIML